MTAQPMPRPTARSPLYKTKRWQILRIKVLVRDTYTCQMCGTILRDGRSSPYSAVVDHLQPAGLRPDLFFDEGNLQAVCKSCHDGPCSSIEARHTDPETIKREKQAFVAIGYDATGRPTSPNHPWNAAP